MDADMAATMDADVAAQLQAHFVMGLAHVTQKIAISAQRHTNFSAHVSNYSMY